VPPDVTRAKFQEQVDRWHANADAYARRGWLLLSTGDLSVDIGFLQNVAMGGRTIPVMTACVRLDYWNFDLWPPSPTFLDPVTRQSAPSSTSTPRRCNHSCACQVSASTTPTPSTPETIGCSTAIFAKGT